MIPLFLGLTIANLALLMTVFVIGLTAIGGDGRPTDAYIYHIALGLAAGLMVLVTHVGTYTYFMATSKWLHAAAEKAGLDPQQHVAPAYANKSRAFKWVIAAIVITMLAMFAGAGADPTFVALWPGELHLAVGILAIAANLLSALAEYRYIVDQGRLMDASLAILNDMPGVKVEHA